MYKFKAGDFVIITRQVHFRDIKGKVGRVRWVDVHDPDLPYKVRVYDADSVYLDTCGGWFSDDDLSAANLRDDELVAYLLS